MQDEDVDMDGEEDDEADSSASPPTHMFDHGEEDEDKDEDEDLPSPYPRIRHALDLSLGSPPLHIAFPPLSSVMKASDDQGFSTIDDPDFPSLFLQDIVVAVICQDGSIHVITVPLKPQRRSSGSEEKPSYEDVIVSVPRPDSPVRNVPNGISLTWTSEGLGRKRSHSQEPRSGRGRPGTSPGTSWTLLVATTSGEANGMLKVHAVPLVPKTDTTDIDVGGSTLLRSEYLPIQPCNISFKPTTFPSQHHSHLFITDTGGSVRLYDAMSRSKTASAASISHARGRWLTTLHSPLESSSVTLGRSRILDAAWAMSGGCIVVLLASGHWGIWDIDGAGPTVPGGLFRGTTSGGSISGAAVTPLALKGFIGSMASTGGEKASRESDGQVEQPTQLAPMTPNTRKSKQGRLFDQGPKSAARAPTGTVVRGGISVADVSSQNREGRRDTSVVLWYNGEIYSIPSLHNYWQRAASTNNNKIDKGADSSAEETLFGSSLSPVHMLPPRGELITSLSQSPPNVNTSSTVPSTLRSDIIISTESRITFVQPHGADLSTAESNLKQLFRPQHTSSAMAARPASSHLDQDLLRRGELDLGGMDRMLNGMNGTTRDEDPFAMSGALQPASR